MDFTALDTFMKDMPKRGYPACEIVVTKDGETVYRQGIGYADASKTRPVSNKDIYWIFSATKVITCIAAMRLVEAGKISLDDPVSKYIPEYADLYIEQKDGNLVKAKNVMTVEHLFTMTGGMDYNIANECIKPLVEQNASTLDIVRVLAKHPLRFESGTHYMYSLCHDVLGGIIEIVSGMKLSEYFSKYIFEPLGIVDMGFRPNEEQKARFSIQYDHRAGTATAIERPVISNIFRITPNYESGGAGLFATVDEYIKIISTVACGGAAKNGYRLLSEKSIKMMQINRLCDDALDDFVNGRLFGYGWGLCGRVHINPTVSLSRAPIGEFGWDGAANAFVLIDASNRVAVFFGTHIFRGTYGYNVIHPTLRNLVYEGLEN